MKNTLKCVVMAVMMACGGGQMMGTECTKDSDCKGSRVCDNGACVDPSGSGGGSQQSGSGGGSQQSGSGGGTHSGSGGGTQSGSGGGTQQSSQCLSGQDTDCPTGYWCNMQQCQATSLKRVGETCTVNSDCAGDACLFRNDGDVAGYCSKRCESFSECPTFWDCAAIANAAGTYCVQSN